MFDPFATSPPILSGSGTQATPSSATTYTPASIILTPGAWFVWMFGFLGFSTAPTISLLSFGIGSANGSTSDYNSTVITLSSGLAVNTGLAPGGRNQGTYSVPPGTTKTVFAGGGCTFTGGSVLVYNVTMWAQYIGNG